MGSRVSPSYANIFMGFLEETFIYSFHKQPLIYLRYIDDVLMLWHHDEKSLNEFFTHANACHDTIKFTFHYSKLSVNFLDVNITLYEGKLITQLYRKPTDKRQLLHYTSHHPKSQKNNIPYSQFLRLRRICSEDDTFNMHAHSLRNTLLERKYPETLIADALNRATATDRDAILTRKTTRSTTDRIPLVTSFHTNISDLNTILKRNLNILHADQKLKNIFTEAPFATFRKLPSIGRLLCPSRIRGPHNNGCSPCGSPRCQLCKFILTSSEITSYTSPFSMKITHTVNCKTPNIIYILHCTLCHQQYVGETQNSMTERFYGHKSDIVHKENKPVAIHFNNPSHNYLDHLKVTIIETSFKDCLHRKNKESFLISKFNTLAPFGINVYKGTLAMLLE